MGQKIATCCYCGTRAVLAFDRARHELACSACGAPLHDMKFMPKAPDRPLKRSARSHAPSRAIPGVTEPERPLRGARETPKKKARKPFMRRFLEDIWDEVEDIFD
ncbi:MAG: hypothetical protein RIG84_19925 [Roseovarius sp.]